MQDLINLLKTDNEIKEKQIKVLDANLDESNRNVEELKNRVDYFSKMNNPEDANLGVSPAK